jgi:hypothetical protein
MAITLTTLSGAVSTTDANVITVASATGAVAGAFVLIDQEVMQIQKGYPFSGVPITTIPVLRGVDASLSQTHPTGAQVKFYLGTDTVALPGQQAAVTVITAPSRVRTSYTAAGAITIPLPGNDAVAVLNGTTILAMTLANPTTDMDGCRLTVAANGKAAHTVTYAAGLGNLGAGATVITFRATQAQGVDLIAVGGFWVNTSIVAGAATVAGAGVA